MGLIDIDPPPLPPICLAACSLPKYSEKSILRDKLLYAIHHAATMQADFRMRDGEGFDDVM